MRLQSQYLPKAWMQAAVDQVAHEYEAKGYRVTRDERMGRYRADLVARKGKEQIVLEFKQGPWSAEWQQTALALRKRVQQDPRGAFRLVVVSPPTLPQIDVEGLNEILASLCHGDADSQVDELATHHFLEEIADIEVDNVKIGKNSIELVGDATAEYRLQFGSDSDVEKDEGCTETARFPLHFHLVLEGDLSLSEVIEFSIDTSGYHDEGELTIYPPPQTDATAARGTGMTTTPNYDWFRLLASWSTELLSATDRIHYLIGNRHQPTKGSYREALLRRLLRRVLPDRFRVSTGFIYRWNEQPTRQLDVLIWDAQKRSALLEEGELAILTDDSVTAVIEVKSTLTPSDLRDALDLLSPVWWLNWRHTPASSRTGLPQQMPDVPFRAVFAYNDQHADLGTTVSSVFSDLASFYQKQFREDVRRAIEHSEGYRWINMVDAICIADGPQIEQTRVVVDSDDGGSYDAAGFAAYGRHPNGDRISVGRFCMYRKRVSKDILPSTLRNAQNAVGGSDRWGDWDRRLRHEPDRCAACWRGGNAAG